jgi:hypothetical protein
MSGRALIGESGVLCEAVIDPRADRSLTLPEPVAGAQPSPLIRSMPNWNVATGASGSQASVPPRARRRLIHVPSEDSPDGVID